MSTSGPEQSLIGPVAAAIRDRRTEKVLGDLDRWEPVPADIAAKNREIVLDAVRTAGWAPFHFPRRVEGLAEPWRAHVLWDREVYQAARHLRDEMGVTSKEPQLAAGCHALVIVTWLPEFSSPAEAPASELSPEKRRMRDEEHLAAASAMVQNLLVLLTAYGMGTYWSSGGKLRGGEMFDFLGIPREERFLAGVFIEYPELRDERKGRKPGALRDQRGETWLREVKLS